LNTSGTGHSSKDSIFPRAEVNRLAESKDGIFFYKLISLFIAFRGYAETSEFIASVTISRRRNRPAAGQPQGLTLQYPYRIIPCVPPIRPD